MNGIKERESQPVVARARDLWVGCVAPEAVSMRDEGVGDAKTNELTCR